MSVMVVAEKPSVARDIARVLGANRKGEGLLEGNGYVVTWAIGHLVGLAEPHQVRSEWKRWDRALLPMIPSDWPLVVLERTQAQFGVLRKALNDASVERIICATDAGREGELIFRFIYEAAKCRKPVSRLWISSLTDQAIRDGFKKLRSATEYEPLAAAARGRSQADWLVGMNLSRAYGLSMALPLSVGRVQTPTLAMVVERELEIRNFKPEDYLEVVATFSPRAGAQYRGTWFRTPSGKVEGTPAWLLRRLTADGKEAAEIVARARRGRAHIESLRSETRRMPPPLLYDLTELQRHANRLHGLSAQRTLAAAQSLYEKHKLLSYPRTDSRHISQDVAATLPEVVRAISSPYAALLAPGTGQRPLGRRFVDDSKVTDHHAIIPTDRTANLAALSPDERRLYDLVCRRLLEAWHGDHVWDVTTVITAIHTDSPAHVDRFKSTGTAVREVGWKVLDPGAENRSPPTAKDKTDNAADEESQALPSGLAQGQAQTVLDAQAVKKTTRPPPRYTEATLLTAMETAGAALDDKELSAAMKERGLGTPATRAAIIETLLARDYLVRRGKVLEATDKGIGLIAAVDPMVKSPAMTGDWEARLKRIERGQDTLDAFMAAIERYVREVVDRVPPPGGAAARPGPGESRAPPIDDSELERRILGALRTRNGQSTGRLCRALVGENAADRRRFEAVLSKLSARGALKTTDDVFETGGRRIPFKRAWLAGTALPEGGTPTDASSKRGRPQRRGRAPASGARTRRPRTSRGTRAPPR